MIIQMISVTHSTTLSFFGGNLNSLGSSEESIYLITWQDIFNWPYRRHICSWIHNLQWLSTTVERTCSSCGSMHWAGPTTLLWLATFLDFVGAGDGVGIVLTITSVRCQTNQENSHQHNTPEPPPPVL